MKIISKIITFIFITLFIHISYAGTIFDATPHVEYCSSGGCGLTNGVNLVRNGVTDMETNRGFSEYIQDIVVYVLSFVSLIAVIYLIYAGFIILTSAGDEEKLKKTKNIIIYVIIGIIIMWLAWSILTWLLGVLNIGSTESYTSGGGCSACCLLSGGSQSSCLTAAGCSVTYCN